MEVSTIMEKGSSVISVKMLEILKKSDLMKN